jgi:predicted TPR repeat methyltransferase
MASHGLASLSGEAKQVLDAVYIRDLFDGYSSTFELSLAALDYQAPRILRDKLLTVEGLGTTKSLRVLDIGAGTGLVCLPIRNSFNVSHMAALDVSSKMLARAASLDCYNETVVSEAEAYLEAFTGPPYDLVVAADVLVYIPRLEALFRGIARVLGAQGVGAFTVEGLLCEGPDSDSDPCLEGGRLQVTGRYAHSTQYVTRAALESGLSVVSAEPCVPRLDRGEPIRGTVFVVRPTVGGSYY